MQTKKEKVQAKAKGTSQIEQLVNGEPIVAKVIKLNNAERGLLIDYVEFKARSRKAAIGKLKDDDFFTGAMTAMFALGMEPPVSWVFGIMSNRPEMYGMGDKNGK